MAAFDVDHGTHGMHYVRVSTLKDRLNDTLEKKFDGNASAWAKAAGLSRAAVRKMCERESTDDGATKLGTLVKLAAAASVSPLWLTFGEVDPPIGALLLAIAEKPGLRETLDADLSRWHTSTVVRVVTDQTLFQSQSDAVPVGGWAKALDTIEFRAAPRGTASAVIRATANQNRRRRLPKGAT